MPWSNDDAYDVGELEFAYVTPDDVPVYGYAELPDASTNRAPIISNVSPTPGTTIAATQAIGCDVTDADGATEIRRIILAMKLPNGTKEIVHDGDSFCAPYTGTRTSITNGYRYSFTRSTRWPSVIELFPYAIDKQGSEAA